jgi:hypothetical protein
MPVFEVYRPFELARKFVFASRFGRASGSLSPVQTVTASTYVPANRRGPMLGLALLPIPYRTLCGSGRRFGRLRQRRGKEGARIGARPPPSYPCIQKHLRMPGWPRLGAQLQTRESSDNAMLNAFCRVAPSVHFNVRAILAARLFFLASAFNVRTGSDVNARRFDFLAM